MSGLFKDKPHKLMFKIMSTNEIISSSSTLNKHHQIYLNHYVNHYVNHAVQSISLTSFQIHFSSTKAEDSFDINLNCNIGKLDPIHGASIFNVARCNMNYRRL